MAFFDAVSTPASAPTSSAAPPSGASGSGATSLETGSTPPSSPPGGFFDSISAPEPESAPAATPSKSFFDAVQTPSPQSDDESPSAPSYFTTSSTNGASMGFSTTTDPSGRPLFAYRNPGDTSTTTDMTRVATTFDPRVAQPLTKEQYYDPRAVQNRYALKQAMGATANDQLDHWMALALGGSNEPENLRDVPTAQNQEEGNYEEELAKEVASGKISYYDAQVLEAKNKGMALPYVSMEGSTSTTTPTPDTSPGAEFPPTAANAGVPATGAAKPKASLSEDFVDFLNGISSKVHDIYGAAVHAVNGVESYAQKQDQPFQQSKQQGDQVLSAAESDAKSKLDTPFDTTNIGPKGAVQAAWNSFTGTIDDSADRLDDMESKLSDYASGGPTTGSQALAATGEAALGLVNGVFSPITSAFAGAAKLPGIPGIAAQTVNKVFSAIGSGSSDLAQSALQATPYLSDEQKSDLYPVVGETAALVSQILAGKGGIDDLPAVLSKSKDVLSSISDHIKSIPNKQGGFIKIPGKSAPISYVPDENHMNDLASHAADYVANNKDQMKSDYLRENGNVYNVDRMKDLIPGHTENPTMSEAFHKPAADLMGEMVDQRLKSDPDNGKDVAFMGGATGAGKSTAVDSLGRSFDNDHAVIDGTLADGNRSRDQMRTALKNGHGVAIHYVDNTPDRILDNVITRAEGGGRTVPIETIFNTLLKSRQNVIRDNGEFGSNPDFKVNIIDNRNDIPDVVENGIDYLKKNKYSEDDIAKAKASAYAKVDDLHAQGKISDEIYEGLTRRRDGEAHPKPLGTDGEEYPRERAGGEKAEVESGLYSFGKSEKRLSYQGSRFKTAQDLINEISRPKSGRQGLRLNPNEIKQLIDYLIHQNDELSVKERGIVYRPYGAEYGNPGLTGTKDVILGHTDMGRFGESKIVAELENGKVTGWVRTHGTPLDSREITAHLDSNNLLGLENKDQPATHGGESGEERPGETGPEIDLVEALSEERAMDRTFTGRNGEGLERKEKNVKNSFDKKYGSGSYDLAISQILDRFIKPLPPLSEDKENAASEISPDVSSERRESQINDMIKRISASSDPKEISGILQELGIEDKPLGYFREGIGRPGTKLSSRLASMKSEKNIRRALEGQEPQPRELKEPLSEDEERTADAERSRGFSNIKKQARIASEKLISREQYKANLRAKMHEVAKSEKTGPDNIIKAYGRALDPLKHEDAATQDIFKEWYGAKLAAKELAQEEFNKFANPKDDEMNTIHAYQAGALDRAAATNIRKTFDAMYTEAYSRGVELDYRKNYLPQVYADDADKTMEAAGKYLESIGMTPEETDSYMKGEPLPQEIAERLKLNSFFSEARIFPDYATAEKFGLHPKYRNIPALAAHYRQELETIIANKNLIEDLANAGKIGPDDMAPPGWQHINAPGFEGRGYMASPTLARMIDGFFRDEDNLTASQLTWKTLAKINNLSQHMVLSTGVPFTNIHFFGIGQVYKALETATGALVTGRPDIAKTEMGNLWSFLRSHSDSASVKFFKEAQPYITMMAKNGINVGDHIARFGQLYEETARDGAWEKMTGATKDIFEKVFTRKMFGSMLPQLYINTFRSIYDSAMKDGIEDEDAQKLAADAAKKNFGMSDLTMRAKDVEDKISSIFFAPKFRESMVSIYLNQAKSLNIKDASQAGPRAFLVGSILAYAAYNVLNKEINGYWMWDNPDGRMTYLRVPAPGGNVVYVPFNPSLFAVVRNVVEGGDEIWHGQFVPGAETEAENLSMGFQALSQLLTNTNYYGSPIYNPNDRTATKVGKMTQYVGEQFAPSYLTGALNLIEQKNQPLAETLSQASAIPLSFGTTAKEEESNLITQTNSQTATSYQAHQAAEAEYSKIKASSDSAADFDALSSSNPKLAVAVSTIAKEASEGLNTDERLLKTLQVSNGQRAQAIARELDALPDQKSKETLWDRLVSIKVISPQVAQQITPLLSK